MARYKVTGPNGKQYLVTGPSGASKDEILGVLQEKLSTPLDQPTQPTTDVLPEAPDATFGESVKDIGVSALQGVLGLKEAATGIADIPTFGMAGKGVAAAEKAIFGGTSQEAREKLQQLKSAEAQQQEKEIAETKGFLPTIMAYKDRPGALAGVITESLPSMGGGAALARGAVGQIAKLVGKKAAPLIAGAVGEGAITSGSIAESTRQESESGLLTPGQAGISTLAGVFTGSLGVFGGRVAQKLGVADIDTLMAGGVADAEKKSILKQAVKGALSESVFEELPQSLQEQIMQNLAAGRPYDEGVAEAGASGMLAGAFLGGPASALSQAKTNMQIAAKKSEPPPTTEKKEEEPTPTVLPPTEKREDTNVTELLQRARTNIEGKIDEQLDTTKPREGVQVSGGPEGGVAGVAEGADGSRLVRDRIDTQSTDVGAGTQPITLESLASNINTSGLEFKNPAQLRKYLTKQVTKTGLAQLELESPTAIKDLFDQYKDQLETKPLAERVLKLEEANKQARLKQQEEFDQAQLDALPKYLKTVNRYAKEAPLTKEQGMQTAAVERAFDTIDTSDIKGLKRELQNDATYATQQALATRKARIKELMTEQKITEKKAKEIVGPAENYTFSSLRPTQFKTREELIALIKKYEGKGKKQLTEEQAEEAKAREEFIDSLSEREKVLLEQQKYEAINLELESNRQQVINERLLKQKQKAQKKATAEVEEQIQETNLIPEIDTKPIMVSEGKILNKGTRIVNKAVNSAISNNKPFLEILKDVAGGQFNKYFSYQTVADMLQEKIATLAKPKGMGMKGMALPTVVYGTVEKGRPGKFDPATNTITIDPNNAQGQDLGQILMHESMHYMLDHIIDNRKNLSDGQKNALKRLEQLHKQVKTKLGKDFDIPNLKEFVAEAFTNSEFQRALASLRPAPGSKLYRTASDIVWSISKAIVSALGLRFSTVPPVVLEETIDLVSNIITDKAYTLPTETMMGKAPSFAPKQAGEPKPLFDPKEYKKKQSVKEYHKPSPTETLKRTFVGERARDYLITKFQNSRYAIKKWQKDLQKAGLIKVLGDGFNNINDYITTAFGEANFRQKEYLEKPMQDLQNALQGYATKSGKSIGDALGDLQAYAVALHEPERRHIKYLKTVPLTPKAADERKAIFDLVSSTTNLTTTELQDLRTYLENLVANNKDASKNGIGGYTGPEALNEQSSNYNVTADLNSDEIAALQQEYQNDPNKAEIDNILALLKPIQSATIQLNKMGNYWSQATDNITTFYGWKNYVPLKYKKGKMPSNVEDLEIRDKRLSNELRESVGSFEGSTEEAENPIIQTMVDASLSAARAGRVGLTQAIKNAVEQKLIAGKVDPKLKFTAKEIYEGIPDEGQQAMRRRSSVLHYDKDGSLQIIQIDDPQLLESIRRTYQEGHPVLDMANKLTSLIGQSHTRYNPAFPVLNFVRDSLTNAFVMAVDMGPMEAFKYIGAISASVANGGLFKANKVARLYENNDIAKLRELAKKDDYVRDMLEFIEQGGIVSIVEGLSVKGQLNRLYKDLNRSKVLKVKDQIDPFFDAWVYTFELAARTSAYQIAKTNAEADGATPEAAKQIATVYAKQLANFEEVGEWGKGLGAMFVFFRPSATGAVRAFESIGPMLRSWESVQKSLPETITKNPEALAQYEANWRRQSRAAAGVVMSLLGAGATVYLMAAGLADDDDEGRNKIVNDDLSRWTRFARFDIGKGPNGEERVVQIPWGFGLGGFAAAGAQVAGAVSSKSNSIASVMGNLVNISIDSFIPIPVSRINPTDNFAAFAIDSITPSAVRPFLEYTMNMNSLGQEIYNNRQSRFGDAYTGGDNIPDMYKDASRLLANITNGGIDWSPNTMYFFANNYADGLTRLSQNFYGIGLTLTGQKDFDPKRDLIVLESFLSNKSNVDSRQYNKIENEVLEKQKTLNMFKQSNPEKYIDYIIEHPFDETIVETFNKMAGSELKKLREDANVIRRMPGLTPRDRAQMLEMNKYTQNLIKSNIVSSIEMLKDLED